MEDGDEITIKEERDGIEEMEMGIEEDNYRER